MRPARGIVSVLVVGATLLAVSAQPRADGPIAGRRYKLQRRQMELMVHSRTEGSLEIKDYLVPEGDGPGVARLDYVLHRAAPLFRFVVGGPEYCFGTGSAATPDDVNRALDYFVRRHSHQDVKGLPGPAMLGDRMSPNCYPSAIAVVARDDAGDIAVQVSGEKPIVELIYDIGVTGVAMTERSLPGVVSPKFRNFTRFEVPQLDAADTASSSLRVTILPKTEHPRPRLSVTVDGRAYWSAEVTRTGGPTQAVDIFPSGSEEDRLSATVSNSYVLIPEQGKSTQRRVQTTQLSFVLPPPTIDRIIVVGAVVDVAPDRAEVVAARCGP